MQTRSKHLFLTFLLFLGFMASARAQQTYASWRLESPRKGEVIKSGELLITIRLLDSVKVFKGSFQLLIDDYFITNYVKFTPDMISILYTFPLSEGRHTLEMHCKAQDIGFLNPIKTEFYVNKFSGPKKDSVIVRKADKFQFSGNISANYKVINTTGPGSESAQTPPYFRDLSADVTLRLGKVSFPFKYYSTSDDIFYPQTLNGFRSRTYLEYGIEYKGLRFTYGDHTPVFDRLVLTGIRVKGAMLTVTAPRFQMTLLDGYSQDTMNGVLRRYTPSDGPPPPGLIRDTVHKNRDSTYLDPSRPYYFRRRLSAARFSFGSRIDGSTISLSLLRARDEQNSIQNGANPSDNIVIGADESFVTNGGDMKVNAGAAISFYTADISRGPISQNKIDSFYGYKVGFNPMEYKDVFVLNLTTNKPGEASTADYFTAVFKGSSKDKRTDNLFMLDYHYYGSSYISEGSPFTQNDLWCATAQDQLGLFNRKVMLMGRYSFQENNVSANLFSTMLTQVIGGTVIISPSPKLPQLSVFVNDQMRTTPKSTISDLVNINDQNLNYTGVLSYNIPIGATITGLNVSYTNSERNDQINTFTSNKTQIMGGGLTESITPINTVIDLRYSMMQYSSAFSNISNVPLTTSYDAHIRYTLKKLKTTVAVGADITQNNATSLMGSSASTRNLYNVSILTMPAPGLSLTLEAGMSPYIASVSDYSYQQNYALVRLMYNFNFLR